MSVELADYENSSYKDIHVLLIFPLQYQKYSSRFCTSFIIIRLCGSSSKSSDQVFLAWKSLFRIVGQKELWLSIDTCTSIEIRAIDWSSHLYANDLPFCPICHNVMFSLSTNIMFLLVHSNIKKKLQCRMDFFYASVLWIIYSIQVTINRHCHTHSRKLFLDSDPVSWPFQ